MNDTAQQWADQSFVEYVVKQLVDHPEAVEIHRTVDDLGVLITLKVHPDDMGKMIGKSGQTAKSLRTLLRIVGSKENLRVNLKIIEPVTGTAQEIPDGETQEIPDGEML